MCVLEVESSSNLTLASSALGFTKPEAWIKPVCLGPGQLILLFSLSTEAFEKI